MCFLNEQEKKIHENILLKILNAFFLSLKMSHWSERAEGDEEKKNAEKNYGHFLFFIDNFRLLLFFEIMIIIIFLCNVL